MKIKAEDVIEDTIPKIFEGLKIVFEFSSGVPFKEKQNLREVVTKNGGVVSYMLTKQSSFLILVANDKADSYQCQRARKNGVPVLHTDFLHHAVQNHLLPDYTMYELPDKEQEPTEMLESKESTAHKDTGTEDIVTDFSAKTWNRGESGIPAFNEETLEVASYSILTMENCCHLLEIDVNKEHSLPFRLMHQTISQGGSVTAYQFSEHAEQVLALFSRQFTYLTELGFKSGDKQTPIPVESLGTCQFRQYNKASIAMAKIIVEEYKLLQSKLARPLTQRPVIAYKKNKSLKDILIYRRKQKRRKLDPDVKYLVDMLWKEASMIVNQFDDVAEFKTEDVEKAEGILLQIKDAIQGGTKYDDITNLSHQFYKLLPLDPLLELTDMRAVSLMSRTCQVLRDMLAVGELTFWEPLPPSEAKYQALKCDLEIISKQFIDYDTVKCMLTDTLPEAKVLSIFAVDRPTETDVFRNDLGPTQLLFHSTYSSHLLGILSRGLLLPKVVVSEYGGTRRDAGHLGYGIYFTDSARASCTYSSLGNSQTRFIFIAEVSLGCSEEVVSPQFDLTQPPPGYDSLHGVASTPEKPSSFQGDEFAIYNSNQQKLRYLIEYILPEDVIHYERRALDFCERSIPERQPLDFSNLSTDVAKLSTGEDLKSKVDYGLVAESATGDIPLTAVHIRARLVDLASQVVITQSYTNNSDLSIEAKYVFPLDEMAAVCGFEAYINNKHVIGEVKEKKTAHQEYKEAISKGHGAYLMDEDEETPDVFTVSVGNLPPKASVIIKITYVAELKVDGELIVFNIPNSVATWKEKSAQQKTTQSFVDQVDVGTSSCNCVSLEISVDMPFDIKTIRSTTHKILVKNTVCKAVVKLQENQRLDEGFGLEIGVSHIHVPRMWVEEHPEYPDKQACMLAFYPEPVDLDEDKEERVYVTFLLDMSNSMNGIAVMDAVTLLFFILDRMDDNVLFKVIIIGTEPESVLEDFHCANKETMDMLTNYFKKVTKTSGKTDVYHPLRSLLLLQPTTRTQNVVLISDGHINDEPLIFADLLNKITTLRLFTVGVSSSANRHRLRSLARLGKGTYDHFDNKAKSKWKGKVDMLLERLGQPSMSSITVEWQQYDNDPPKPIQAPREIMSLFYGTRLVIYGFVSNCQMAFLKATIKGKELSTVVSSSAISNTKGLLLHRLTARNLIRDWEDGLLSLDRTKHEVEKMDLQNYIIQLSMEYSIVTQLTSFIAVEERTKDESFTKDASPNIVTLLEEENVDDLQYMEYVIPEQEKFSKSGGNDHVSKLRSQVDEVKDVMTQNIDKVLERGERLDDLMDKTEELEAEEETLENYEDQAYMYGSDTQEEVKKKFYDLDLEVISSSEILDALQQRRSSSESESCDDFGTDPIEEYEEPNEVRTSSKEISDALQQRRSSSESESYEDLGTDSSEEYEEPSSYLDEVRTSSKEISDAIQQRRSSIKPESYGDFGLDDLYGCLRDLPKAQEEATNDQDGFLKAEDIDLSVYRQNRSFGMETILDESSQIPSFVPRRSFTHPEKKSNLRFGAAVTSQSKPPRLPPPPLPPVTSQSKPPRLPPPPLPPVTSQSKPPCLSPPPLPPVTSQSKPPRLPPPPLPPVTSQSKPPCLSPPPLPPVTSQSKPPCLSPPPLPPVTSQSKPPRLSPPPLPPVTSQSKPPRLPPPPLPPVTSQSKPPPPPPPPPIADRSIQEPRRMEAGGVLRSRKVAAQARRHPSVPSSFDEPPPLPVRKPLTHKRSQISLCSDLADIDTPNKAYSDVTKNVGASFNAKPFQAASKSSTGLFGAGFNAQSNQVSPSPPKFCTSSKLFHWSFGAGFNAQSNQVSPSTPSSALDRSSFTESFGAGFNAQSNQVSPSPPSSARAQSLFTGSFGAGFNAQSNQVSPSTPSSALDRSSFTESFGAGFNAQSNQVFPPTPSSALAQSSFTGSFGAGFNAQSNQVSPPTPSSALAQSPFTGSFGAGFNAQSNQVSPPTPSSALDQSSFTRSFGAGFNAQSNQVPAPPPAPTSLPGTFPAGLNAPASSSKIVLQSLTDRRAADFTSKMNQIDQLPQRNRDTDKRECEISDDINVLKFSDLPKCKKKSLLKKMPLRSGIEEYEEPKPSKEILQPGIASSFKSKLKPEETKAENISESSGLRTASFPAELKKAETGKASIVHRKCFALPKMKGTYLMEQREIQRPFTFRPSKLSKGNMEIHLGDIEKAPLVSEVGMRSTRFSTWDFKSLTILFKLQSENGSWPFDSSTFSALMNVSKEEVENILFSAGLKSLGKTAVEDILQLAVTMIVLAHVLILFFVDSFPLKASDFKLDIDEMAGRDKIMKELKNNQIDCFLFCSQVNKAVEFCGKVVKAHPLAYSQLELGPSWEYAVASWIGVLNKDIIPI